jgi:hypothetical protein
LVAHACFGLQHRRVVVAHRARADSVRQKIDPAGAVQVGASAQTFQISFGFRADTARTPANPVWADRRLQQRHRPFVVIMPFPGWSKRITRLEQGLFRIPRRRTLTHRRRRSERRAKATPGAEVCSKSTAPR